MSTDFVADYVIGTNDSMTTTPTSCVAPTPPPVSKHQLCQPQGIAVAPDGTVAISEGGYTRVTLYLAPEATDRVADRVIGQADVWRGSACNSGGVSASSLCVPFDAAVDGDGNVYIADLNNNRVLGYFSPLTTDFVADLVFGQNGSFTSNGFLAPTATTLASPAGVAVDTSGNLYASDALNCSTSTRAKSTDRRWPCSVAG